MLVARLVLCFAVVSGCAAFLQPKNLDRIKESLVSSVSGLRDAAARAAGLEALGVPVPKAWCEYLDGTISESDADSAAALATALPTCEKARKFDGDVKRDVHRLRALSALGFEGVNASDSADNVDALRSQLQALHQRVLHARYATAPDVLVAVAVAASLLSDNKAFVPLTFAHFSASAQQESTTVPLSLHNALGSAVCAPVQLRVSHAERDGASLDTSAFAVEQSACQHTLKTPPLSAGVHNFRFQLGDSAPSYLRAHDLSLRLVVTSPAQPKEAEFVAHNAVASKSSVRLRLAPSQSLDRIVRLDEASSLTVTAQVQWLPDRTPTLSLLRLANNETQRFVDFVGSPANDRLSFSAKLSAAAFESSAGFYSVTVLLSDALMTAPLAWTLGQVHIDFRTAAVETAPECGTLPPALEFVSVASGQNRFIADLLPALGAFPAVFLAFLALSTGAEQKQVTAVSCLRAFLLTGLAFAALLAWTLLPLLDTALCFALALLPACLFA